MSTKDDLLDKISIARDALADVRERIENVEAALDDAWSKLDDLNVEPSEIEISVKIIENATIRGVVHVDDDDVRITVVPEE